MAKIFTRSGYYRAETTKRTQKRDRAFTIARFRKQQTLASTAKCARLVLGLIETFQMEMGNAKGPRIEEVRIPREMERLSPSLARISGVLLPDQDMVNFLLLIRPGASRGFPLIPHLRPGAPHRAV